MAADIAFHATILEISHNRFFHQLTPIVETALRFSIRLTNKTKGALADYDAHDKIYRAIRNGNADGAARACRELINEALALVIKTREAAPESRFRFSRQSISNIDIGPATARAASSSY